MRWMAAVALAMAVCVAPAAQEGTCEPPVRLTPMAGFELTGCESWEWDEVELLVDYDKDRYSTIAGAHWELSFWETEEGRHPSPPQIVRNVVGALAPLGGTVVWRIEDGALVRLEAGGAATWVRVSVTDGGAHYELTIVREARLRQEMAATAEALAEGLRAAGHATLTGVLFDLDSDRLWPESDAALAQAAKLLREDPGLRLWVVGHTDATGSFEHNMDLSRRRAAAVVRALVERYGIAAGRLEAHGVGPLAPVASNATEEGRARNRRVELVAR